MQCFSTFSLPRPPSHSRFLPRPPPYKKFDDVFLCLEVIYILMYIYLCTYYSYDFRNEAKITKKNVRCAPAKGMCKRSNFFYCYLWVAWQYSLKKNRKNAVAVLCILRCKMQKRFFLKRCENNINILIQLCKVSEFVN